MHPEPRYERAPFVLRRTSAADAPAMRDFYVRNWDHLAATSPTRPPDFETVAFWEGVARATERDFEADRRASLILVEPSGRMLGYVSLANIVRGALQGADLSYAIDEEQEGRGLMRWAVSGAIDYAFGPLRLHRLQASHLPENRRSAGLLARLGFRREGYAERLLFVDGQWRDHVLNALVSEDWRPDPAG